jgi:hypothetical protein
MQRKKRAIQKKKNLLCKLTTPSEILLFQIFVAKGFLTCFEHLVVLRFFYPITNEVFANSLFFFKLRFH